MLNSLFKLHKRGVLIHGNASAVDCVLKQNAAHAGYALKGVSNFTGLTFDESGAGFFGDTFEITLDMEDIREKTNLIPVSGWFVDVTFPQMNDAKVSFCVENVAIDRTLGMILLKCSASTTAGAGKRVYRTNPGGI